MKKISFVFPGQGSQFIGMGKKFYENYESAKEVYDEASNIVGFDLAALCFEGRITELAKTMHSFVAILTTGVAMYKVFMEEVGIQPIYLAGHSLGEYTALTCAGALSFSDAVNLLCIRAKLADILIEANLWGMTIIDSIASSTVEELCKKSVCEQEVIEISCYNSPTQVSVSGHLTALEKLENNVRKQGGQATPLLFQAPFHSSVMKETAEKFLLQLNNIAFRTPQYPVISNVSAKPITSGDELPDLLTKQLIHPVKWQETMDYIQQKGSELVIEFGAKGILTELMKEDKRGMHSYCFGVNKDRRDLYDYLNSI